MHRNRKEAGRIAEHCEIVEETIRMVEEQKDRMHPKGVHTK